MPVNHPIPQIKLHLSAKWLLGVLAASVFLIELLVMFILDMFPPIPKITTFLIDSTLLSALIFPIFYYLVFRPLRQNIIALRQAEEALRVISVVFETKYPILITDAKSNILRANKSFLSFTGYNHEEIIGKNPRILQTGRYSKNYYKTMWNQLLRSGTWTGETRIKDRRGHEFPIEMVITAIKNEHQQTTHYVAIYSL